LSAIPSYRIKDIHFISLEPATLRTSYLRYQPIPSFVCVNYIRWNSSNSCNLRNKHLRCSNAILHLWFRTPFQVSLIPFNLRTSISLSATPSPSVQDNHPILLTNSSQEQALNFCRFPPSPSVSGQHHFSSVPCYFWTFVIFVRIPSPSVSFPVEKFIVCTIADIKTSVKFQICLCCQLPSILSMHHHSNVVFNESANVFVEVYIVPAPIGNLI